MTQLLKLLPLLIALPCSAAVDFATQIAPILEAKCVKCHGEKRALGELALHDAALPGVIEDGLILEDDAENSEVYARLILPADDKLRMPKGGDPLPAEQIELIKNWINQGAKLTTAAASPTHEAAEEPVKDEPLPSPAPADQTTLDALAQAGAAVTALYEGSPLLSVAFSSNRDQVTDATLDAVAAAGASVAWLDLAGTQVTDAGVAKLTACTNLMRLHLEKTQVTDAAADALAKLDRLEYLNLYGTAVTDQSLASLAKLPRLAAFYLWQTDVTYDAAKQAMADHAGLEVNLGWDHPGVVRERLTQEQQRVSKAKEEAEQRAKQAEATLQQAKQDLAAATDRLQAIEQELKSLEASDKN